MAEQGSKKEISQLLTVLPSLALHHPVVSHPTLFCFLVKEAAVQS